MCVCQHKAIRGFPDRGHSWAYSAPFSCPEKRKQWVHMCKVVRQKKHILKHRWSLFFIYLPSKCMKSPSGDINAPCAVLDSRSSCYCCVYRSHTCVSSVILTFPSHKVKQWTTSICRKKDPGLKTNHSTPTDSGTRKHLTQGFPSYIYKTFFICKIVNDRVTRSKGHEPHSDLQQHDCVHVSPLTWTRLVK